MTIKTISPIDGSIYVERNLASDPDIQNALTNAQSAFKQWRQTPLSERKVICAQAVDAFVANKDQIAEEITWQMGRPIAYTASEVAGFEERARYMIEASDNGLEQITVPQKEGFTRYIKREPLGVVFVIAPWNYPYLTAVNAIVPALLAGNAVVVKHSAQTPLCAERMVEAFQKTELPDGVFQYLHLSHDSTARVIQSPEVNFVAFTGSVAGGEMVEQSAAGRFIGTGLELGGKDPAYVRKDANLQHAIETVTDGAFFNSGQSCCGIERIYVEKPVYDDVVAGVVELVNAYKLDRPDHQDTTLGPLVRTAAAEFVRMQTQEAINAGSSALIDPSNFSNDEAGTPYLAPQVLVDVDHNMRVMTEETFGPVVGIMAVDNDEHAVQLMNDSEFGLTACVFTQDDEAAARIGDQVNTGTWFMNRCDYLDPALAWTGVKNSGRGCTLSSIGFENLTRPKSYHLKTKV